MKRELNVGSHGFEDVEQRTVFLRCSGNDTRNRFARLDDAHLPVEHQVERKNLAENLWRNERLRCHQLEVVRLITVELVSAVWRFRSFRRGKADFGDEELNMVGHFLLLLVLIQNRSVPLMKVKLVWAVGEVLVLAEGRHVISEEC